ncbi:MAG TPA: Gfo/Idh/MocA family oxidoreductase [Victivallales bacterium]|nr:Gfo/Idh/MocA family oxidoreductase [Victivallales bacterium]
MEKTIALIGAGQRGKDVYAEYIYHSKNLKISAVAEPNICRREFIKNRFKLDDSMCFNDWKELLKQPKLADAVIISTNDDMHYEPVIQALRKDYHIYLEKPITNRKEELLKLKDYATVYCEKIFMVAHVLRYTSFINKIKEIIDSGVMGQLISIQHNENIGYFHMAHSFVRGNWRNSAETSPLILAKSCHDMDLLLYLINSKCKKISSFGNLSYFKKENAPDSSGERCTLCNAEEKCPYSALKIYSNKLGEWPATAVSEKTKSPDFLQELETGQYGKCVFKTDNNVVDHQVCIMEFCNGVTATFNLSGFTHEISRTIKIMGTCGEIRGDMDNNKITFYKFLDDSSHHINLDIDSEILDSHSGGDYHIMKNFEEMLCTGKIASRTSLQNSIESHIMAMAAEESRLNDKVIFLISEDRYEKD